MDELLNGLLLALGKINPMYAVAALVVWTLFGSKIKDVLGKIKLPKITPAPAPDKATPDDTERWLEEHPLLDRLWQRLKVRFTDDVLTGNADEDELYAELLKAIKPK